MGEFQNYGHFFLLLLLPLLLLMLLFLHWLLQPLLLFLMLLFFFMLLPVPLLLLLLPRTWVEHGVIADGARSDSTNPKGGVGAHEPWACLGLPPMPLPPCLCLALSSRMLHLSVIFDIRLQFLRPARDLTGGNHFRGTFFVWTLTSLNKLLSV